jgi:predicted ABC-type ATPase
VNESEKTPNVIVIGGPNGAGKTTFATSFLAPLKPAPQFVNADIIATELSPQSPEAVAVAAGRLMLRRISELTSQREDFAIESTLASRTLATRLETMKADGYRIHLAYLWLYSSDLAVARVAERVNRGGHHVPDEVVRRRYDRGLYNLFERYIPLADEWAIYDNSSLSRNRIAYGSESGVYVEAAQLYQQLERMAQR